MNNKDLTAHEIYGPVLTSELEQKLATEPVLLVAPVGSGTSDIAEYLVGQASIGIQLTPLLTEDSTELVTSVVRQLVRSALKLVFEGGAGDARGAEPALQVAAYFGRHAAEACEIARGALATNLTLTYALRDLPEQPRVAVQGAERLPEQLMWELRDLATSGVISLLLTTRPQRVEDLVGPDRSLHGNVHASELSRPTITDWTRALDRSGRPLMQADLEWILERTRGRVATTLEVLSHLGAINAPRMAWSLAVRARIRHAIDLLRLAASVHGYAPRLLLAIALGEAPYAAIKDAPSQRVARALSALHDLDVIEQPAPRKWQIADPLLHAAVALQQPREDDLPAHDEQVGAHSRFGRAAKSVVRTALVGYGYWGPNLARNLVEHAEFDFQLLCDNDPQQLVQFAHRHPYLPSTQEFDHVLEDASIDAVVIATPPKSHYVLAKRALEAGKHVFVERPLATRLSDASKLVAIAEKSGRVLMPGHTFIYSPAVNAVRELIQEGIIGDINFITSSRMNLGKYNEEGVVWDLAPVDISILLYLLERPLVEIACTGSSVLQSGVPETAFLTLTFSGGTTANVQISWLAPRKVRQMIIVGSQRMVQYDDTAANDPVRIYDRGMDMMPAKAPYRDGRELIYRVGDVVIPRIGVREPVSDELLDFAHAIRTGDEPRSNMGLGLDVVAAVELAEASLNEGGVAQSIVSRQQTGIQATA